MRRAALAVVLAAIFSAEAVPLLLLPPARCCPLVGCPMHAKHAAARFAPCAGRTGTPALPPFLGRAGVLRTDAVLFARSAVRGSRATFAQRAVMRTRAVETRPPRSVVTL